MYLDSPDRGMARLNIQENIFGLRGQHLCTHRFFFCVDGW